MYLEEDQTKPKVERFLPPQKNTKTAKNKVNALFFHL
jgi:hypothetical protein